MFNVLIKITRELKLLKKNKLVLLKIGVRHIEYKLTAETCRLIHRPLDFTVSMNFNIIQCS